MWDREMGHGKFGNLGLILSDLRDQSGSRQAFMKAKCCIFYFPHLLVESPSAEEGNWLCNGSFTPSTAKGRWSYSVFCGTLKESTLKED